MSSLLTLPPIVFCFIIIAFTCSIFLGAMLSTRRLSKKFEILGHDSMEANLLIRMAQTIFAVLVGFVVITVWVDYDKMAERTSMEATTLGNLYRDCRGLGDDQERKVQRLIRDYVDDIVTDAWPKMSKKEESEKAWHSFNLLYGEIIRYQPKHTGEEIVLRRLVEHLNELANFRRMRHIRNNTPKIPDLFWGLMVISCGITVTTSFFFHMKNKRVQIILTTLLSIMMGLIFSVLLLMNYPYRSSLKVSPYPFEQLLDDVFPSADVTTEPSAQTPFSKNATTEDPKKPAEQSL